MNTVTVGLGDRGLGDRSLGDRSYPVHVGSGLMTHREIFAPVIGTGKVMVVTNQTVAPLYLERLRSGLDVTGVAHCVLPDGEGHKNLQVLETIFDALVDAKVGRDGLLVALGGGVIGDITGFAAACYQRGIDYVQVGTTLLAQVDSSVGGKTAVNHPRAKNMIGAFHQPVCVVSDIATLQTLPDRELRAGLAEVIKYGAVWDQDFFEWIEGNLPALLACDPAALETAVVRSCQIKAAIVAQDERESGVRALLNFGHTFGHAIESGLGYGQWLHGEAVAAGMCLAAEMSARMGLSPRSVVSRIRTLVERAQLPVAPPGGIGKSEMLELMTLDKKVSGGQLRFVLLEALGRGVVCGEYRQSDLESTIDQSLVS